MTTTEKVLIGLVVAGGGYLAWKHMHAAPAGAVTPPAPMYGPPSPPLGTAEATPAAVVNKVTTQGAPKGIKATLGGLVSNLGNVFKDAGKTAAGGAINQVGAKYGIPGLGASLLA